MMKYLLGLSIFSVIFWGCGTQKQNTPEQAQFIKENYGLSDELSASRWKKTNLREYTILDMEETPEGKILAATSEGLFISADQGLSWNTVFDDNMISSLVNCLETDGKYMYAGIGSKGLFRSEDNGFSWVKSSNGIDFKNLIVRDILSKEGKLYLGTSNGIYMSEDSAQTWREKNLGVPRSKSNNLEYKANYDEVFSIIAGGNSLYAICNGGILSLDDMGEKWTLIPSNEINVNIVSTLTYDNEAILAGRYFKEGIYKSIDGGITWDKFGLEGKNLQKIVISPNGVIYAGTNGHGIFRTSDYGKTWSELNKGLPKDAYISSMKMTKSGNVLVGIENRGIYRLSF